MKTYTLEIEDSTVQKVMNFLKTFSKKEVKIIPQTTDFEITKKEVQKDYQALLKGTQFYTIEEVEQEMNDLIKHESKTNSRI
ncbi:MAG: hypothetical protein H6604_08850 [Flavobacteriales bacterium]|nr:hypothetical protein [Flavobacteriales bacterium]